MRHSSNGYSSNRILLVDDEQLITSALAHILRAAGYWADVAQNGREALEKVDRNDYDLIICDIKMPVMDGESFYRELRAVRPMLTQRVVFCTGDADCPAARRLLNDSGAPVIRKPFCLRNVLDMVSLELARDKVAPQAVAAA